MATTQLVLTTYNDIYFSTNGWKLIIQGVGYFDKNILSIGIKTDASGEVQFLIDELENFLTNYLHS
jgi:hypothetical protein